jgi:hypothetical protein
MFDVSGHFALVRTKLEYSGTAASEFSPDTGGSITIRSKVLLIRYVVTPDLSEVEMPFEGHSLELLFDNDRVVPSIANRKRVSKSVGATLRDTFGRSPNQSAALTVKKIVKGIVLGILYRRVCLLLVEPDGNRARALVRVGIGRISFPLEERERMNALFEGNKFPTETSRLF